MCRRSAKAGFPASRQARGLACSLRARKRPAARPSNSLRTSAPRPTNGRRSSRRRARKSIDGGLSGQIRVPPREPVALADGRNHHRAAIPGWRSAMKNKTGRAAVKSLSHVALERMDAYWRAANYLSVGQIYLYDNPLLRKPLKLEHVKPRLLGHWGTTPGLNFVYVHLNRIINQYDLNVIYVTGPGHGGPGLVANTYLEGTYSELYPDVSQDEQGLKKLFTQFSFPGGIPSHAAAETP